MRHRAWDHPRGCGENRTPFPTLLLHLGSPPRMRGKRVRSYNNRRRIRITPADAGKTKRYGRSTGESWDHPRGCGENASRSAAAQSRAGSPPRMRGKRAMFTFADADVRITPADAGKTRRKAHAYILRQDHPRGCGENTKPSLRGTTGTGSPPRMRGKPSLDTNRNNWRRITPADAGKTLYVGCNARREPDHPRGCGENTKKIL